MKHSNLLQFHSFSRKMQHSNLYYCERKSLVTHKTIHQNVVVNRSLKPPVTISLSDRPSHFFQSGFWPDPPVTILRSHRPGFFLLFFSNTFSTLNVNDHTTVSQTGFSFYPVCETMVWSLTYRCKMSLKKRTLVWQTVVWSLGFVKFVWSLAG